MNGAWNQRDSDCGEGNCHCDWRCFHYHRKNLLHNVEVSVFSPKYKLLSCVLCVQMQVCRVSSRHDLFPHLVSPVVWTGFSCWTVLPTTTRWHTKISTGIDVCTCIFYFTCPLPTPPPSFPVSLPYLYTHPASWHLCEAVTALKQKPF